MTSAEKNAQHINLTCYPMTKLSALKYTRTNIHWFVGESSVI